MTIFLGKDMLGFVHSIPFVKEDRAVKIYWKGQKNKTQCIISSVIDF
jgi:hypothetical protein